MKKTQIFNKWAMLACLFCFLLVFKFTTLNAQVNGNYVTNGNFETFTTCPSVPPLSNSPNIGYATGWQNGSSQIGGGHGPTPDYFNTCDQSLCGNGIGSNAIGSSLNKYGTQNVRVSGTAGYAGFKVQANTSTDYREYLQMELPIALTSGKEYDVTFYVSRSEYYYYSLQNIGALISVQKITQANRDPIATNFTVGETNPINEYSNWYKISGTFTAVGGEKWITIGAFGLGDLEVNADYTTTTNCGISSQNDDAYDKNAYYFVDDVSIVEKLSPAFTYTVGNAVCEINSVSAFSNIASSWVTHLWTLSNSSNTFSSALQNPVFSGVPAGTYTLTHSITQYGVTYTSTQTVLVTNGYDRNNYTSNVATEIWTATSNPFNNNSNGIIKIRDRVTIKTGANITANNLTFVFGDEGKLIIEMGAKFIASNSTFTVVTDCGPETMWSGIEVWGSGNTFNQDGPEQGTLELLNNSVLEHAHIGISAYRRLPNGQPDKKSGGAILIVKNSFLRNNRLHVELYGYSTNIPMNASYFSGNIFESTQALRDQTLYPNGIALAYIRIRNVNGVRFVANTFRTIASIANLSTNRSTGIIALRSNVNVQGNNQFITLTHGIYSNGTASARGSIIKGNFFSTCLRAVHCVGTTGDQIEGNTFGNSIPGTAELFNVTIYMQNCTGFKIVDNNLFASSLPDLLSYGILVHGTGSNGGLLYGNKLSGSWRQIQIEGINKKIDLRCNEHTNYSSTLYFQKAWNINPEIQSANTPSSGVFFPSQVGLCGPGLLSGNKFLDACLGNTQNNKQISTKVPFTYNYIGTQNNPTETCTEDIVLLLPCSPNDGGSSNCTSPTILFGSISELINAYTIETDVVRKQSLFNSILQKYQNDTLNDGNMETQMWINSIYSGKDEEIIALSKIYFDAGKHQDAINLLDDLITNDENNATRLFYQTLSNDYNEGMELDSLSVIAIDVITFLANADFDISAQARHLLEQYYPELNYSFIHNPFYDNEEYKPGKILNENLQIRIPKIYPNPSTNHIQLFDLMNSKTLNLYNSTGLLLQTVELGDSQSFIFQNIKAGIYFVDIVMKDNELLKYKAIVR